MGQLFHVVNFIYVLVKDSLTTNQIISMFCFVERVTFALEG